MKLAITTCATDKYAYALSAQARRIHSCILENKKDTIEGAMIVVGDESKKVIQAYDLYKSLLEPIKWEVIKINVGKLSDNHTNYKEKAQMLIGQLRTAAFTKARSINSDFCLSLDSDVLPQPNALNVMLQMLEFDNGYYSISTCPYPSQGGGGFLGGRGTIYNPISEDFLESEREVPEAMQKKLASKREEIKKIEMPITPEKDKELKRLFGELHKLTEEMKKCSPPKGNVFKLNSDFGWRKRGWFDQAYPALGKGSILPSDWCGFGCTLMNRQALNLAHFDGYDAKGTEDLYIVWHRWYQAGLKINVIPHSPADHVIRNPGKPNHYVLQQAYHETEGEYVGHLRFRSRPFYSFDLGENFDPENDGQVLPAPQDPEEQKPTSATSASDSHSDLPKQYWNGAKS